MGWECHKSECSNLKKIGPRVVPDAARILARIIFKLKVCGFNYSFKNQALTSDFIFYNNK